MSAPFASPETAPDGHSPLPTQLGSPGAGADVVGLSEVDRAWRVFPGGSNGEFNLPHWHSLVVDRAKGSSLWDTRGREYLDFSIGWGSVLVGHARSEIVHAVVESAVGGTNFAYTNTASLTLAEELTRLSPACEQVRFCASGTEATTTCMRIARGYMEKDCILKFEGAYHGSNDEGVTSLFPGGDVAFPQPEPSSAGINCGEVLVAPFNDSETAREMIRTHARELAAVIVEPFQRCLPPRPGFLETLRDACLRHNVLLIFDEVVTGFRLAYGGAQEHYGVIPDLIAYGKALGGGLPIGAFGGRRDIMELVCEDRCGKMDYVWTASSLGCNTVSCSAANAALSIYRRPDTYPKLYDLGAHFREGLARVLHDSKHEGQVLGDGPIGQIVFSPAPVHDYRSYLAADRDKGRAMMLGLVGEQIFLNPMGTKLYLSLAHTHDTCDEFCERLSRVLSKL